MARIAEGLPRAGSTTTITTQRKKKPIEAKALTTEVQMLAGADVWGRAAFGRSWLRSLVGASPLFLAPMASISIFITLAEYEGSLSLFADAVKEHGFWTICAQYGPHLTTKGIAAVICWVGIQALLYCLLPGEQHQGQLTPAGYLLNYKINGLSAWIVTHLLYGVLSWLGILDPGFIPRNWSSLIGAMNLAGFVISALALVKAYVMPTHPEDRKFSGSFLYDFFMGIELNPRLGENFDLKLFSNGRAGMMVWTLIDFSNMAYQYQNQGYVEPSLILVTALQTLYVVDFFINESWYLRTIDVKFDHYGFYLSWGCFCFLPTTYTIQGQYLGRYPSSAPTSYLAFFFTLGVAGYIIFRSVNHQKEIVRRTGGKCTIWGKPAECIVASFRTSDGRQHRSLLLCSGWWGWSRHANYLGDLILSFSTSDAQHWCLGLGAVDPEEFKTKNEALEKKLMELGGRKWLYTHTYYTEEQFRELNDRCWVKKSGLDADERDDKGWGLGNLLNKWPIGGIYGMILAFYSGDINLHRRARWSPTRLYISHSYVIHKYVLINWATVMLPDSNADMQINILADGGVHEDDVSELSLKKTLAFVEMVERSFQYLPRLNFTDNPFKQFTIPQDWRAWEVAWLYRLPAIITHASYPARLIESGCIVDNVTNCHKACGSEEHMFSNPETLWNCLTLATVAMMSTNRGPDTISNQTLEEVDRKFNTGPLDEFWKLGALLSYVKCALQSCSDSKFGGCPPELWTFQCQMITSKNIKDLSRIMSTEYCDKADPGIDYDIAGPGIIVAYLIQFTIVLFFALCYKITKAWIRNFTLISLLPFQGPAGAVETAFQWQKMVSRSTFGVAVASTLIDLQEAQAVFLGTISIAAIITFSSSSGTGLGNISSLLSWLTNNLTVRGMVSAGMYPLLFVQLIIQKTHNRWWYTLVLVFINWVLVVLIARPQTVDESSLLEHFTDSSPLERCGNHTGPRTFCQTFNKPAERGSSSTTGEELGHLDRDAESFFKFHSRIQAPMHVIMAFLILDWILAMIRMHLFERGDWLSHKAHALMDSLPLRLKSVYTRRYFMLFTEAIWISMEVLTIVMGAIGVHEFAAFMHLLGGGESGNESKVALSKWGFGQLVAVCVWVPVILKFACLMVDGALPGWRKRLGQFIEITQRKENDPDGNDVVMETLLPSRPTKRGQTDEHVVAFHATMASSNPERTYARWSLRDVPHTPATDVLPIGPADGIETVFDDDSRRLVDPAHIQPGGKYHCSLNLDVVIVKLQIQFKGQDPSDARHAQATGWLIMPNLIITAAHCVYDHTYNFGKAVHVRAFVGYNGKNSIDQPGVQFRRGLRAVIPKDWIISDTNRASDVAFIKVEEFNNIVRISQQPTTGFVNKMLLSVVGYPCDKSLGDERGAQMYERTKTTECDLSKTAFNMLEHTMSFAGGKYLFPARVNPPVLISGDSKAIGISSYGTGTRNTATVFRGRFGTYLSGMVSFMSKLGSDSSIDIGSIHANYRQSNDFRIFDKMEYQLIETKDVVPRIAKLITPGIIELYPKLPPMSSSLSDGAKRLVDAFTRYTNQGDANEMSEFLGSIVETALSAGSPNIDVITRAIGEFELSVTDMSTYVEILCYRALMAMRHCRANGVFDHFVGTVGKIGKTVIGVAPVVVQNILESIRQEE
ncbi:ergosterol biosynthesis ERG4/ERG24 family-domain-containing protein [Fusarium oxysporum]|nr:ergosterol biosynthesis ERG4/ERG24 family-domain-containing protein [Fusarium oxysporum]